MNGQTYPVLTKLIRGICVIKKVITTIILIIIGVLFPPNCLARIFQNTIAICLENGQIMTVIVKIRGMSFCKNVRKVTLFSAATDAEF